jgi:glycosyltransferase involved in cell wall biosynthesis
MRVAFLNPSGELGGAELCLLDMIAVLREARSDWELYALLSAEGPLRKRAEDLGCIVEVLPFPSELASTGDSRGGGVWPLLRNAAKVIPGVRSYREKLRLALQRIQPDVVHSNGFKMHVLSAMAKTPGKLVWHVHDYVSNRPLAGRMLRHYAGRPDAIITNSQSVAENVKLTLGARRKVVPMLNVVDLKTFTPNGPALELDALSGLPKAPEGVVRVGLLATMAWWKGHRLFLDALARVPAETPVRGYIVGGALYQTGSKQETIEGLRAYAQKIGVADRVGFTGFVVEPASAMRALDVVVHASTEPEPFGRVIVEAMGCGKPVISSGVGGAGEILMMGDFALAFKLNNADTLARAIAKLVGDTKLRDLLARNGLNTARERFGRERLARELPPVYEGL